MQIHPRRPILLATLVVALLTGACNSAPEALPKLDDPKEILAEALRTTAELQFVHARLDAATGMPGASQSYTVDGDLDLGRREFHALVEFGGMGMTQRAELLLVGTDMFMRTEGGAFAGETDGKWQRSPLAQGSDPRSGIPPTEAIVAALDELLEDPALAATLAGSKACGDRQCYEVRASVAPELTWRLGQGMLFGGQPGAELGPPDPLIPEIIITVLVDEATRRLVSAHSKVEVEGGSVEITATLSNHDVELRLVPPPPDQVADPNQGILDNVGGEVVEPVPAAS